MSNSDHWRLFSSLKGVAPDSARGPFLQRSRTSALAHKNDQDGATNPPLSNRRAQSPGGKETIRSTTTSQRRDDRRPTHHSTSARSVYNENSRVSWIERLVDTSSATPAGESRCAMAN
ncbi:uncharacterized protein SPSK_10007 [Sporothrix schenckii 1099-18]|uniref:Uncharacterized protein n=1 Tax=Sporothrix schenckii 1099-18 TaxID=1397361 RepID=A0A0F2M525_SPOSC|nr:uncharacterized protein SPSK_10007 [Sporothrix schenckii 1099-18]KJR84803.1 hypothetical protein SPSK_10007 [Sporothrix schenckii 1099-18]